MYFFLFKALHIIGFVAWFAGLFYLVRLFVYHAEAYDKPQVEKEILTRHFNVMERRLFFLITQPAMVFTVIFGGLMIVWNPIYLTLGWMQVKLFFLVLLVAYHYYCKVIIIQLETDTCQYTSQQFRMLNEVPTIFLIGIVLVAVLKSNINWLYMVGSIIILSIIFYVAVKLYKRHRDKLISSSKEVK